MKRIFLILSLMFAVMIFFACSLFGRGGEDVVSLTFFVNEKSGPPEDHTEAVLIFVPDYELRTLEADYSLIFPAETHEADDRDINTEGIIGGDFFDRFEEVLDMFSTKEQLEVDGSGDFKVVLERENGSVEKYEFSREGDLEKFNAIESFYSDVAKLFTEDLY